MQITTEQKGDLLELRIEGRLDNEWSDNLTEAINELVRQGSHSLLLDLTKVNYLSSAGVGALVRAYKQFQSIRGFFGVGTASPHAEEVIRMTGLSKMLMCGVDKVRTLGTPASATNSFTSMSRVSIRAGMTLESYDLDAKGGLTCEVLGDPKRLPHEVFFEKHCRRLDFPIDTIGLGLGAFGRSYADCEDRFGEFLAVSGAAAYMPTSKSGKSDYQISQGDFIPQVQVAYGLRCYGDFKELHRFESGTEEGRIRLSTLVDECLAISKTNLAAIVILAETSGLIGTALRRSPAMKADSIESKLSHPEIRRWLSFSPEQAFSRSLALVVGVALRGENADTHDPRLMPLLRPLRAGGDLFGHFHAAVFSYRPFKKRKLNLAETVGALFETEDLQAVLHLLHDDREISGAGESEFVRGACWVGPISSISGGVQS